MSAVIDKSHPDWESLYAMWLEQKKPGWLAANNGITYQVLRPSDDDIKFAPKGAFDELYGSSSAKGITHG